MKLITRHTDYAVSALCRISGKSGPVSTAELCRELDMPYAFLRGILQRLQKHGILLSARGKTGGFVLSRSLALISLYDIMNVFQDTFRTNGCVFRKYPCPRQRACVLREKLGHIQDVLREELETVTLASLVTSKGSPRR